MSDFRFSMPQPPRRPVLKAAGHSHSPRKKYSALLQIPRLPCQIWPQRCHSLQRSHRCLMHRDSFLQIPSYNFATQARSRRQTFAGWVRNLSCRHLRQAREQTTFRFCRHCNTDLCCPSQRVQGHPLPRPREVLHPAVPPDTAYYSR